MIHLIVPLRRPLCYADLMYILDLTKIKLILEPDYSQRWQQSTQIMCEKLIKCGYKRAAIDFYHRQERLAKYRRSSHHIDVKVLREPGENDELELLATDGLNGGRYLFRLGEKLAQGWQCVPSDDLYVVDAMLVGLCGNLSNAVKSYIEDTKEYTQWLNNIIDSLTKQKIVDDSVDFV